MPRKEKETFAWQLEPIGFIVKQNCKVLWRPSSYLAIDEAMIAFRGNQTLPCSNALISHSGCSNLHLAVLVPLEDP